MSILNLFKTIFDDIINFVADEDEQIKRLPPPPPIKTMTYTVGASRVLTRNYRNYHFLLHSGRIFNVLLNLKINFVF